MLPLTKRQREILDYLNEFIQQHGYAPSLEEIGQRFSLSSLATVHKHLTNLQDKGFIRRSWNRSRSVELLPSRAGGRAIELTVLSPRAAELQALMPYKAPPDTSKLLLSPMPGLLVHLAAQVGQTVQAGERLAVIEAMKMENILTAQQDVTVAEILAKPGESLAVDQAILRFQ